MSGIQFRHGGYRVSFRYQGKRHIFTLGEVPKDEAENKARQVDYLLMRLKQRLAILFCPSRIWTTAGVGLF